MCDIERSCKLGLCDPVTRTKNFLYRKTIKLKTKFAFKSALLCFDFKAGAVFATQSERPNLCDWVTKQSFDPVSRTGITF